MGCFPSASRFLSPLDGLRNYRKLSPGVLQILYLVTAVKYPKAIQYSPIQFLRCDVTDREFLKEVQQFFPRACLRSIKRHLYAAYCRDREVYVSYNFETQRWLVQTAYDYIFEADLTTAVAQMSTDSCDY
nr:ANL26 [Synechococcus elongatus PCC 7942 = FACHB-805]